MQTVIRAQSKSGPYVLLSRFFSTNKNYLDPYYTKLMLLGTGFSSCVAIAHIPRLTTIRKFEMKTFDTQSLVTYTPNVDMIPFNIRTKDEIQRPILQVLNDTTGIEFSEVVNVDPEKGTLLTVENKQFKYDYLVLAAGLVPNYSKVKGLKEALEDIESPVISSCTIDHANKCNREFELFYTGKVIFYNDKKSKTYHSALNAAMLFDEFLRQRKGGGHRSMSNISYITNDNTIFPNVPYSIKLQSILREKQIEHDNENLELIEVDKSAKRATFVDLNTQKRVEKEFDLLFVNPEFTLPNILTGLADQEGYLNIDPSTLVHKKHHNVFALGHCARTKGFVTTAKSVIEQSLTMNANIELTLQATTNQTKPEKLVKYSGLNNVPFYVGNKKCLLAEIDPFRPDHVKEPSSADYYKEIYVNQKIYFGLLTQGVWFGETGFKVPKFRVDG